MREKGRGGGGLTGAICQAEGFELAPEGWMEGVGKKVLQTKGSA